MNFYFFDLDGTLEDSREDMARSVNAVRELLGLNLREIDDVKKHVNRGMHDLYVSCFDDFFSNSAHYETAYEKVKTEYEKHYLENICIKSFCYDNIEKVLEEFAKNSKIIVITNKPEKHSRALLVSLEINQYITDVMGGDSCAEMKPSPLPLQISAKRNNFSFENDKAFMIGDSAGDIQAGKAFGAKTIWCSYGYIKSYGSIKPDYTINSPHELLTLAMQ